MSNHGDSWSGRFRFLEQRCEDLLPVLQRKTHEVPSVEAHRVKKVIDNRRALSGFAPLQQLETGPARLIQRHDLAVEDGIAAFHLSQRRDNFRVVGIQRLDIAGP